MGQARRRREAERGGTDSPMFTAAVDLVARTGAGGWQIRYSDDEQPVVWLAVATYRDGRAETAAGLTPLSAALRLCERLVDGGTCAHCHRPAGFTEDFDGMPAEHMICWFAWDPEKATFRRGCEGDDK